MATATTAAAPAPPTPVKEPLSPQSAYREKEKAQRQAERDAERAEKKAVRDKARAEKEAERARLRAIKDKERDAAREKRKKDAELRRQGKHVPDEDEHKPEDHSCDESEEDTPDEHTTDGESDQKQEVAAAAKPAPAGIMKPAVTAAPTAHSSGVASEAAAAAAAAAEADGRCGFGNGSAKPTPAIPAPAKPAPTPAAVPAGPLAIKPLPLPKGAQVSIGLPIEAMKDIRTKKHSWNVIQKQYSKYNENNTLEATPEESCNPGAAKKGQRPLGGMGFQAAPTDVFPGVDVELKYSLQFGETFNPQKGGKLPGLMMAQAGNCKGGASGGRHSDENASVRVMWRSNLMAEAYVYATAATDEPEYNKLESCHYNPAYGDSIWRGLLNFKPKVWNSIVLRAKLNTPGKSDGLLSLTVNGDTKQFDKMMWRKSSQMVITALFFSTFYGGSKPDWACPTDTCIRFKDFVLTKYA